ncbi:hypothetical protein HNR62_001020 [Oceanisphaera litoralis]|uniref:hypothetical protein n=1 Tax=Oceanisphaera litoralis TaxID=225144 RepID=UPI001957393E|nr:hypothetical protein [Oceanisphaera litoralis]MBM7455160.1 hypothetical protein [Oceanisphaera litoralis]
MAEGLGSLASGFLSGFQVMNNYQRGKKEDERADKAMSLRETESQRAADYQQWGMKRTEGRDAKADEQWGLGHALQREQLDHSRQTSKDASARGWAQLSMQQRQQKLQELQEQRIQRQQEQEDNQLFLQQNGHVIQSVYNDPSLLQQNPDLLKVFEHPAARHLDPRRFANPDMANANRTVMGHLNKVVQMGANGELDNKSDQELYQTYNQPEVIKAANTALGYELSKGVGDIDPQTGKAIKSKSLVGFVPGPNGDTVVPTMRVEYEDGSSANRPATLNRTADPDDPVKEVPVTDLIKYFGAQGSVIQQMQESGVMGSLSQTMGFTEGPDKKGYKTAATGMLKEKAKQLASVDKMLAKKEIEEDQAVKMKQDISATFAGQKEGLGDLHNINQPRQKKNQDPLKAWVESAPDGQGKSARRDWLKVLAASGAPEDVAAVRSGDPAALDERVNFHLQAAKELSNSELEERIAAKEGATPAGSPQQAGGPALSQTQGGRITYGLSR